MFLIIFRKYFGITITAEKTIRCRSSMNSGAMVQPTFWKIDIPFASRCLPSTWRRIPTTCTHSFLEYWAFAQHWRSNVTIRSQFSTDTFSYREFWLKLRKVFFNLRISSTASLFISEILFCNNLLCYSSDKTIGKSFLLNCLSDDSLVYWGMVTIVAR